jgi:hypothetical protein
MNVRLCSRKKSLIVSRISTAGGDLVDTWAVKYGAVPHGNGKSPCVTQFAVCLEKMHGHRIMYSGAYSMPVQMGKQPVAFFCSMT